MKPSFTTSREVVARVLSFNGSTHLRPGEVKGHCRMFDEMHKSYINPPKRCQKIFNKAFRMPDGSELVITINNE